MSLKFLFKVSSSLIAVGLLFTDTRGQVVHPSNVALNPRAWRPEDSVALRYFEPEAVIMSEDRAYFFTVTMHGNLSADTVTSELEVYSTDSVRRHTGVGLIQPINRLVRQSSGQEIYSIFHPRWEGHTIFFPGADEKGIYQYYRYDFQSGECRPMTKWVYPVITQFQRGNTVVANLRVPQHHEKEYPMVLLTREKLRYSIFPGAETVQNYTTLVAGGDGDPFALTNSAPYVGEVARFSSSGKRFLIDRLPLTEPKTWAPYDNLSPWGQVESPTDSGRHNFRQFMLVDVERRTERPLWDAPVGTATKMGFKHQFTLPPQAFWMADESHVILVNAALPTPAGSELDPVSTAYVVGFDIKSGRWTALESLQETDSSHSLREILSVEWLTPGNQLLVRHTQSGKESNGTIYFLEGDRWRSREVSPADVQQSKLEVSGPDDVTVKIRQGPNEPQTAVAVYNKREIILSQVDPLLEQVTLSRTETVNWKLPNGDEISGGLVLPRNTGGEKFPLVIQAFEFDPQEFLPDGPFRHIFAAQSLAAEGIAVLTVTIPAMDPDEKRKPTSPQEVPEFLARIESAIAQLTAEGTIDPSRLGIVGFSRGGYMASQAIRRSKYHFSAAVIDDAFSGSYSEYMMSLAFLGHGSAWNAIYGGPFWTHKEAWLQDETSFNADRIRTPAIFTLHGDGNEMNAISIAAEFSANRRPMEFVIFPGAPHLLRTPKQRYTSIALTNDWMCFWLNGKIPDDPARAARWDILRKQQDEVLKTPPPPKGKWVFVPDSAESKKQESTTSGPKN